MSDTFERRHRDSKSLPGREGPSWRSYVIAWAAREQALSLPVRCGIGLFIVAVASAIQISVWPFIPPSPTLLIYPAVILASVIAGLAGGVTAVGVGTLADAYFLPPSEMLKVARPEDQLELAIFVGVGLCLTWLVCRLRSALHSAHLASERAERAMQKAVRASAIKDEVLAVVAHDLKSPLQTIALSAEVLKREEDGPVIHANVERIRRASARASRLIANLLDAAAIDAGTFHVEVARCSLAPLVMDAVAAFKPLAEMRNVQLRATPVPDVFVHCDSDRLEQALYNVIGNAVQYTVPHGEVTIAAEKMERELRFTVCDTGPGMTGEQIEHAFDRFWRGRKGPGGSGLGLFIARGVVEAHGGTIEIRSAIGGGTTITISLPQQRDEQASAPEHASSPAVH